MLPPEQVLTRAKELRAEELAKPRGLWYLSFAKDKNEGGWQGGVIVEAHGLITALDRATLLGINPGGEVMALPVRVPILPELRDRLLSFEEMESAFGELKRI